METAAEGCTRESWIWIRRSFFLLSLGMGWVWNRIYPIGTVLCFERKERNATVLTKRLFLFPFLYRVVTASAAEGVVSCQHASLQRRCSLHHHGCFMTSIVACVGHRLSNTQTRRRSTLVRLRATQSAWRFLACMLVQRSPFQGRQDRRGWTASTLHQPRYEVKKGYRGNARVRISRAAERLGRRQR